MKKIVLASLFVFLLFLTPLVNAFAYLSIGQVDLVDYATEVRSKAWYLTVSQNQMSDYAVGTISSEEIKDPETGAHAQKDLKIEMNVDEQTCRYSIQKVSLMYRAEWKRFDLSWWECAILDYSRAEQECAEWIGSYHGYRQSTECKVWCFRMIPEAWHGELSTPSLSFKSTIKLTVDGETKTGVINRLEQTEVSFDDLAYARWVGSLSSGDECPKAKEEGVVAAYIDYSWRTTGLEEYNRYLSAYTNFYSCVSGVNTDDEAMYCVNNLNNKLDAALMYKELRSKGGSVAYTSGTVDSGMVTIKLAKLIQYPVINMWIKADWLGIVMPYGMPDIVKAYSPPFESGKTGYIHVEVKNVGSAPGSFGVYADCPSPLSKTETEYTPTLQPGETATVVLDIYGTSPVEVKRTCKVVAYDRAKPENRDETNVEVTLYPIGVCPEGERRCKDNTIEECINGAWQPIQVCDYKCDYIDGEPVCITPRTCKTDADCAPGEVCRNGICVPKPPTPPAPEWEKYLPYLLLVGGLALFGYSVWVRRKK